MLEALLGDDVADLGRQAKRTITHVKSHSDALLDRSIRQCLAP